MCCEATKKMDFISLGNRAFAEILRHPTLWKIWLNFSHRWWKFSRKRKLSEQKGFGNKPLPTMILTPSWLVFFFNQFHNRNANHLLRLFHNFQFVYYFFCLASNSIVSCVSLKWKRAWKMLCRSVINLLSRLLFCFLILGCK